MGRRKLTEKQKQNGEELRRLRALTEIQEKIIEMLYKQLKR